MHFLPFPVSHEISKYYIDSSKYPTFRCIDNMKKTIACQTLLKIFMGICGWELTSIPGFVPNIFSKVLLLRLGLHFVLVHWPSLENGRMDLNANRSGKSSDRTVPVISR